MNSIFKYLSPDVYLLSVLPLILLLVGVAIYRFFKRPTKTFARVLAVSKGLEAAKQEIPGVNFDGMLPDNEIISRNFSPGRLENLESRIELMISLVLEIKEQLRRLNTVLVYGEVKGESQYEEIYRAFDQGKDIGEMVRQFGRDKGEIELILNLRKVSN